MNVYVPLVCLSLCLGILGCGGKKDNEGSGTKGLKLSGKVTFTARTHQIVDGMSQGLSSKEEKGVPAEKLLVRAVIQKDGGALHAINTRTDQEGNYTLSVEPGAKVYVEILSDIPSTRLIASKILGNKESIMERPLYCLRKGPDGKAANNQLKTPWGALSADTTVNFNVDASTNWFISPFAASLAGSEYAKEETAGTGSRVLGILNGICSMQKALDIPALPAPLDLHYLKGNSEPHGSFIEYDLNSSACYPPVEMPLFSGMKEERGTPVNSSGNGLHYFGTISGSDANDDAWDGGVIYPMITRFYLYGQLRKTLPIYGANAGFGLFPTKALTDRTDMEGLRPEIAIVEGFADAMAALALKNPNLPDAFGDNGTSVSHRDIRIAKGNNIHSASHISALAWRVARLASNLSEDVPSAWTNLKVNEIKDFFTLALSTDAEKYPNDIPCLYHQASRLKSVKGKNEALNTEISKLEGKNSSFLNNWGVDPGSANPGTFSFSLDMKSAKKNIEGKYPNISQGEILTSRFKLTSESNYRLEIPAGQLPAGGSLEVVVDSNGFLLSAAEPSATLNLSAGLHIMQFRLLCQEKSDTTYPFTLNFSPL